MTRCAYCDNIIVNLERSTKKFCDKKCKAAFYNHIRIPASLSQEDRQKVVDYISGLRAERE